MSRVAVPPGGPVVLAGRDGFRSGARRVEDLPGPRRWPLVGNTLQLPRGGAHAVMERWARDHGPLFRMRFGPFRAVGVAEPGLIDQLLRQRPVEVSRSPRISQVIDGTGFKGVFTAEGESWRRQRRLVMRALTPEAVRSFFPVIETVTARLRERWQAAAAQGSALDIVRDLKCYSIDVTTWLAMGLDIDTLTHDTAGLQADVETWFETVGRRLPQVQYWRYFRLPADRRSDAAIARLHVAVDGLIAGARAQMATDPELRLRPRNILQALLAARDEPGSEFSDDDVRGNVAVMLFAGEDTTANAMAWLLYHLAREPAACAAARAEVDAVLGAGQHLPAFAQLDALAYLEAVVMESMRLKPIAPVQGMRANVDLDLAGLLVPSGHLLFLLPRVCATAETRFAHAGRFLPERWQDGALAAQTDGRRSMFPFGGGQRHCPGRYLAMVEIKMVAAMVLASFDLRLDTATEVDERFGITMAPGALPLRFVPRPVVAVH